MLTLIPLLVFLSSGSVFVSTCPLTSSTSTMALTLEDFIRISDKNRAEDLIKINNMIESGVGAEVERVVKPMQNQNEERFDMLESEISKLKDAMNAPHPFPSLCKYWTTQHKVMANPTRLVVVWLLVMLLIVKRCKKLSREQEK